MEIPIQMDDLGGKPTIFGNIHSKSYFLGLRWGGAWPSHQAISIERGDPWNFSLPVKG